jgi:hypothetical protein
LQILSHWDYRNFLTTASPSNHSYLRSLGASQIFDYRDPRVANFTLEAAAGIQGQDGPTVPFVMDCTGSKAGSLVHIAKIAQKGTRVAVLLPVILKDATDEEAPEYTFDVDSSAQWAEGVEIRGTRTHFYMEVRAILLVLEYCHVLELLYRSSIEEQDLGIWNHLGVVVNWLLGACKMHLGKLLGACKLDLGKLLGACKLHL